LKIHFLTLSLIILISCKKGTSNNEQTVPPVNTEAIQVSVNASNVIRTLTGNEVGINIDYLMDDAVLPGQNYSITAQSILKLGTKFLRYPEGESADNFLFRKPPYTSATPQAAYCNFPATHSRFYNGDLSAKDDVLDFDEYMTVCKTTGATPLIVVAYDSMYSTSDCGLKPTREQLLTNAKEWVRYANVTMDYNVKYWMIGNESWNDPNYNGRVTAATYANDIADFVDVMRSVDPTIKIIANGRSDWWPTILQSSSVSKIDYLAASNYLPSGFSGYDYYSNFEGNLNPELSSAVEAIYNYTTGEDKNRIGVILSEYNSIDYSNSGWKSLNNLGHALANFQMLADAILQPKLFSACLWNTRWITNGEQPNNLYDALNSKGNLNASGTSLSILGNNLLNKMVSTTSDAGNIKVYASYDGDKKLNVFLLNKSKSVQKIKLNTIKYLSTFSFQKWEFKSDNVEDFYPTWTKSGGISVGNPEIDINLTANSVTMIEMRNNEGF
jgi:alpha-N-arabinofuranosidase